MMCKFLTYSLTLLTIVAGLFVVSACQKEEVSKNEVMLTFNTRSDVADAKSDATTDVESMQELRVIMVNQDGTIIGNQNKPIATDQTQETFNFQAPVKNGNESFTFFAIANESSIVPDNLSWIVQSTGTLFANSINERKTTQIGNDAVFDFSKHIPQTKIWEVSYSEIKESGGNLSITKQLEYVTGKISVHFVNQTDEQQTISNIRILGITPNTKGYLFAQNSNDYVQSDLTGDNVNVIHFDVMDDASDDVTLSAPSNENASPSDSVEYYTYPIDAANIASVTFNGNTYSHPILVANWKGKDHIIELTDVTSLVRNQHLKIKVTLINGEMQVNFAMNREMRDAKYPFNRLKGKDVNTLIFPNLSSAYKLLQFMDADAQFIGPIQMGLNKPIHFTDFESSVRDIVNITAVAVIDAIVEKKKNCIE